MRTELAHLALAIGFCLIALLLVADSGLQAAARQAAPLAIVINEVAWGGTLASSSDEWIELYNNTDALVDLSGWTLASADGSPAIVLAGGIPPGGFYLLERTDDCTISDVAADQPPYTGLLGNDGERLELRDGGGELIDSVDGVGGWPAGSGAPEYLSMERVDPAAPGDPANWASNDALIHNGLDCNGVPVNGTPKARNSVTGLAGADLSVSKQGPASVLPGALITYTVAVSNSGELPAQATWLTDILPAQVDFLAQTASFPLDQPAPGILVWEVGTVLTSTSTTPITFTITGRVHGTAYGEMSNAIAVSSATSESNLVDNHDTAVAFVGTGPATPTVLIEALYYDTYGSGETDEAIRLFNASPVTVDLGGWRVTDQEVAAILPPDTVLVPGRAIWCAREATAFARQFGFKPDFESGDTDPAVPGLEGSWPRLANTGDECLLQDGTGDVVDAVVYKAGDTSVAGWSGTAVEPWTPSTTFAAEGQILYRKRDQATGLPVPDTDTAADWAQDPEDHIDGPKVLKPAWDLDAFFFTERVTETARLTVAVAPDHLYETISELLGSAQERIQIQCYSFRSKELADVLLDRLDYGVEVTLLLEGAPAFEGVTDQERWIADQLHERGAQVLFMAGDEEENVSDRYRYQHAKLVIIDGNMALVGSENLTDTSMPADDKENGTAGRRGVYLITDAPGVVARVQAIFDADADPANHPDVVGCDQVPHFCTPAAGFEPELTPDWVSYTVQFPTPGVWQGTFAFEVIQSPENSLRSQDSLLGLLKRAGPGDTLLVQQLSEPGHWGSTEGTPETDPNPRLEAYLDAARRDVTVRILLDSHFDGDGDNALTVAYLGGIARVEGLDLQVRQGDPTFLGLHNKMVLAKVGGRGYVHVGSINGNEASSKINRELALQIQLNDAYDYLQSLFDHDWRSAAPSVYLPLVVREHRVPRPADHLLISEVYYATIPEKEWVELYNPTARAVDLSAYKIGDAVYADDYEGSYQFPSGTFIQPGQALVVAVTAAGFDENFPEHTPDFEMFDTDPAVANLMRYDAWGEGDWGLSNSGDEVLLLDGSDVAVDVLAYGLGSYPGVLSHPGGIAFDHALERYPAWLDTDDCSLDFRDWPFPSPGDLP